VLLDRDRLARDEQLLHDVFGLLVHAHYRTRPSDLQRILDAPNLAVHASLSGGRAIAATLIAKEGKLPRATCEAMMNGAARIQGHALPDTLVTHAARPEAGELSMVRSVRIAVHPDVRRLGVARGLVEHVHASYAPDLFGTMFGATPELLSFRRSVGYELARVGVSRGSRTGEPSAVMLRPVSSRAVALMEALRLDLARNLDLQLELLTADGILDEALAASLRAGLPSPPPLSRVENDAVVHRYAHSVQPADAVAYALARFVDERSLGRLEPRAQRLLVARIHERRAWSEIEIAGEYANVRAAMRALRPAIRALLDQGVP
jgi:tRNA(Met) cytidine acetyltransferase